MLLNSAPTDEIAQVLKNQGFDTLKEFALKMVLNGLTTIEEVHRTLGGFDLSAKPATPTPEVEVTQANNPNDENDPNHQAA
jgi:hypothetical protein